MKIKCAQQSFLKPGEFYFGDASFCVHTLLGSCVAVTLWHPRLQIGGMCHYLLPTRPRNSTHARGFYADDAIALFLENIHQQKTSVHEYEAKVFGGAAVIASNGKTGSFGEIGVQNIAAAMALLKHHNFSVKASDVGGPHHRKLRMNLATGDVWVNGPGTESTRRAQR